MHLHNNAKDPQSIICDWWKCRSQYRWLRRNRTQKEMCPPRPNSRRKLLGEQLNLLFTLGKRTKISHSVQAAGCCSNKWGSICITLRVFCLLSLQTVLSVVLEEWLRVQDQYSGTLKFETFNKSLIGFNYWDSDTIGKMASEAKNLKHHN